MIAGIFADMGHWLYEFTLDYGVIGLGIGTFLESFGVPTAAAVVDVAAGTLILSGRTSYLQAVIVSDIGLTLGSLASYSVGRAGARAVDHLRPGVAERAEHSKARDFLMRHGERGIILAQLFGPARTWVSLPAGAMKLDVKRFAAYTAIGGAIYCSIVIGISWAVTSVFKEQALRLLKVLQWQAVAGFVLGGVALYVLWRYLRRRNGNQEQTG